MQCLPGGLGLQFINDLNSSEFSASSKVLDNSKHVGVEDEMSIGHVKIDD